MGMYAIRCSKCGVMKYYTKGDFTKDFHLEKNRPICNKCYKKKGKK